MSSRPCARPWPRPGCPLPTLVEAWRCVTQVWASKWNERAFWSRRANGISDEGLLMAVLIQEAIAADYAFVIHTANPMTGDRDELYAELVPGLGEILVGNHAGRALGFCLRRAKRSAPGLFRARAWACMETVSSSDPIAMGRSSWLCRAGLYDSFMLPPGRPARIDYAREELLWNESLRNHILMGVAGIAQR